MVATAGCRRPAAGWRSGRRNGALTPLWRRLRRNLVVREIASWRASQRPSNSGLRVSPKETRMLTMLHPNILAMERLGDEIALLAAHITVATARLLDVIRGFDLGAGWAH